MAQRIIARLDVKGPNLVKGIHLEGLRILGKPEYFASLYYNQSADELLFMDIVASLYGRNNLCELISKVAKEVSIPLTVGGGIRSLEDVRTILRCGADKIAINTMATKNKYLIREIADLFGSSTLTVAIEASKGSDGKYYAFINNGRDNTGLEVFAWAKEVEQLGAGEILLTSIDNEGTGKGFDVELIKKVSEAVKIPVIAHGGAGKLEHIDEIFNSSKASAVAISSLLHYSVINSINIDDYLSEGNIQFLLNHKIPKNIQNASLIDIKKYLILKGYKIRLD
jgi:cyclase